MIQISNIYGKLRATASLRAHIIVENMDRGSTSGTNVIRVECGYIAHKMVENMDKGSTLGTIVIRIRYSYTLKPRRQFKTRATGKGSRWKLRDKANDVFYL